jgi:hypothetical protein
MAKPLFTNNAYSTLASSITDIATTMTVATGEGARFPAVSGSDYFYVTLVDTSNNMEIVKVTARSTDTFTIVRGQDGTSGTGFSASDRVELRPTAAAIEEAAAGGYLDGASIPDDTIVTANIADANITYAKLASAAIATAANIRESAASVLVTPSNIESAAAAVALSDAATIAVDWDSGINFTVTLGGNRTLGFPTNPQPGTWRRLEVVQDGTGSRTLAFTETGYYSASGSAPLLSTDAAAVDVFYLYCRTTSIVEVYGGGYAMAQIT